MAFITPDFSEAVSIDNTPITGVYHARVTNAQIKDSKAGNKYISWEMTLFGATGEQAKNNNRKVWHMTMVSGKGAGNLQDFLSAVGLPKTGFDTDAALGKEVQVTLGSRQGPDGTDYQDVKAVKAIKH
jgi:hypothetical protein